MRKVASGTTANGLPAMATSDAVRCASISKRYGATPALADVTFGVRRGSLMALLGPSGCGKTTTLRLIAGFEVPNTGSIEIDGTTLVGPGQFVPPERRRVGMVFQDYALFPHLSVHDNVRFGLVADASRDWRVGEVLELVGLAGAGHRMPHELSGGQQQRVALARALAPRPQVILLDEPFSNLDAALRVRVRSDVRRILHEAGTTSIFVTHDQEEAFAIADELGVMIGGTVVQAGTPASVYADPATLAVAMFLGDANALDAEAHGTWAECPLGRVELKAPLHGHVTVVVRPEQAWLASPGTSSATDDGVKGTVVDREFYGSHQVVLAVLGSGLTIRSRMGPAVPVAPGDHVTLSVLGPVSAYAAANSVASPRAERP